MTDQFVEQDCTWRHEGRSFTAGGAMVVGDVAAGYMASDMRSVTTWHGKPMGSARVVSSWAMPQSWISSRQYQVEATIEGVVYTGRTMGGGMYWRGHRKAKQPR